MASASLITLAVLVASISSRGATAVECNSTVGDQNGVCTGDYCFNIEDKILGCINFYRMIRDDNIACGTMHLLGKHRTSCICTQPYCGKYDVANMPTQTLAKVNCFDDTSTDGYCTPGPCYVGNDLRRYGVNATDHPAMQRTCMQDWFVVTNFKQLVMYEVPPLANHSACFFDGDLFNCMCKDPNSQCNKETEPTLPPSTDGHYYTCHKASCQPGVDADCTESYLGNETCVGQMCYYLKSAYDFQFENQVYNESHIVRDCLNYSHADPLSDLTFATGFEFGKSSSHFFPCQGDWCNKNTNDDTTTPAATSVPTSTAMPAIASPFVTLILALTLLLNLLE